MARVSGTSNPTSLIEIARKDVGLMRFENSGTRQFQIAKLDLENYRFAGDEQVFIVARAGNTSQRYDMGLVKAWSRDLRSLNEIDSSAVLRFRLLVRKAESAKLVATAENLRCKGDGDIESLLPIEASDLGQRLWRVIVNEDGAVLQCNRRVFPNGPSAEGFIPFRTLVLPEALRQVLDFIGRDPEILSAEGSIWMEWGTWMKNLGIDPPPQDPDETQDWVSDVTGVFCNHFKCTDDLQQFLQKGEVA